MTNATLTQYRARAAAAKAGGRQLGQAVALNARCVIDAPTRQEKMALGERIADASATLLVKKAALAAGIVPDRGDQVSAKIDGDALAVDYEVLHSIDLQKSGGLAHYECFLKVA